MCSIKNSKLDKLCHHITTTFQSCCPSDVNARASGAGKDEDVVVRENILIRFLHLAMSACRALNFYVPPRKFFFFCTAYLLIERRRGPLPQAWASAVIGQQPLEVDESGLTHTHVGQH